MAPESGAAATTSQCQGWAGPGGRSGLEAQHSLKACPSEAGSEVLSQDSEPLSPVAREYRRRPRNLSSELTEPKVQQKSHLDLPCAHMTFLVAFQ